MTSTRFEVEAVVPHQDGHVLLGRCVGGAVRRGDTFTAFFSKQVEYGEDRSVSVSRELIGTIQLVVQEIQYFSRSVEELQFNYSGGLYVTGEGVGRLAQGVEIET